MEEGVSEDASPSDPLSASETFVSLFPEEGSEEVSVLLFHKSGKPAMFFYKDPAADQKEQSSEDHKKDRKINGPASFPHLFAA